MLRSIVHGTLMMALALAVGCDPGSDSQEGGSSTSDGGSEAPALDEDELTDRIAAYAEDLTRANAMSRPSAHGLAATVNVHVTPIDLAAYLGLDPAQVATGSPEFSPAVLLVKEHLDADGAVSGLTAMAPDAASPNGWWWARLGADLRIVESGQVGYCVSCHSEVQTQGWVYGVAADNRN